MTGDKVDAVVSGPSVLAVQVSRSSQPPARVVQLTGVALAEASHRIPEFSIPFGPINGEITDLVRADVPGLRDENHAVQHRVLRHGVEEGGRRLEVAILLTPS